MTLKCLKEKIHAWPTWGKKTMEHTNVPKQSTTLGMVEAAGGPGKKMPKVIPDCRENILFLQIYKNVWLEGRRKLGVWS